MALNHPLTPWTRDEAIAHIRQENAKGEAWRRSQQDRWRSRNNSIDPDAQQQIVALRKEGMLLKEIVAATGYCLSTVHKYARHAA